MNGVDIFLRESNAIEGIYDEDSFVQAKQAWKYLMEQDILTVSIILKTHKILMLNQGIYPDEKGYFRQCKVYIAGNVYELDKD
jgi:hypothetical protein